MRHLLAAALAALLLARPAVVLAQAGRPVTPSMTIDPVLIYCDNGAGLAAICSVGGGGSSGPTRASSTSTGGTIASANAYQSALAANPARLGCTIQNTSTGTLRVFIGAPGSATDGASLPIAPGGSISCGGVVVATDQISVASTLVGATFTVVSQ
jgi:hypothetical protein